MDYGAILSGLITLTLAGIGGLAWLFKLQGDLRVLRAELTGEIELRRALSDRLTGFERDIRASLERIESKFDNDSREKWGR